MNCLQCEKEFDDDYIYCPYCSEKLLTDEQAEEQKAEDQEIFKWEEKYKLNNSYLIILKD